MSSQLEMTTATDKSRERTLLFGKALDPKRNSLNLIRLVLASTVLFAHTYFIIGLPPDSQPLLGGQHLGVWAVAGFFAISGYLITASRQRSGFANFVLLRIARIYPAFIAVLVVTIAVFGPIAHLVTQGTLRGYLRTAVSPLNYFFLNLFLEVRSYSIGTTLSSVPYPDAWNGSLWTLYYEFLCYMLVGVFLIWGYAKRSAIPVAVAFGISVLLYAQVDRILSFFDNNASLRLLLMLVPYFLGGALIRMLMDRIGLHWLPGAVSLVAVPLSIQYGPPWAAQALAPLVAYGLLWLANVIPQPKWVAHNDVSYGIYVYAFPVQQLLAVFGLIWLGPLVFSLVALAITAAFATASWYFIERPALRRARVATGRAADR